MARAVNGTDSVRRASKRQRVDASASSTPLQKFTAWTAARGIFIDPRLDLRFAGDAVSWSISIHAAEALDENEVVVTVPKQAVISRATSALAPHLTDEWRSESPQTVGLELALCLLYERCLGAKSRFEPFVSVLPRLPVQLPFLGHEDDAAANPWVWITGAEADRLDKRASYAFHASANPRTDWPWDHDYGMCKDLALDYFDTVGIPVLEQSGLFDSSQVGHLDGLASAFVTAYTHVSSRDFIVDTFHGVGLVPVADLFNHTEEHNVQFEADQDVCEFCGTAFLTGHAEQTCSANPSRASTPDGTPSEDDDIYGADTLDVRTRRAVAAGGEMFNTYGALSNALLLTRYGFCLDTETDMERYTWDLRFPDERAEFVHALRSSKLENCESALQNTLAFVLESTKALVAVSHDEDDLSPESTAERDGLDGLHALDRVFATLDVAATPLNAALCPLFRLDKDAEDSSTPPGVDEDTVDRDTVNPLFVNATGRISTVLFALVFLVHYRSRSDDSLDLPALLALLIASTSNSTNSLVAQALADTLTTLTNLVQHRLDGLHITARLDAALDLLHSPAASGTEKACIQHAYQEYAALRTTLTLLTDLHALSAID